MDLRSWVLRNITVMKDGYLKMKKNNQTIQKEESADIPPTSPLEGDEEVKKMKRIKNLNSKQLWTRPLVLLAQIKAGDNSNKLKNISFVWT